MKILRIQTLILAALSFYLSACDRANQHRQQEIAAVQCAEVQSMPLEVTRKYPGPTHASRHIKIRAPSAGKIAKIMVSDGQSLKQNDVIFEFRPAINKAESGAEDETKVIAIKAEWDGLVNLRRNVQGILVDEGTVLADLSDDRTMWVYIEPTEEHYLEMMSVVGQEMLKELESETLLSKGEDVDQDMDIEPTGRKQTVRNFKIELILPNGDLYDQPGRIGNIQGDYNGSTEGISIRIDFPNPEHRLRHGTVNTVQISFERNKVVIPRRATFDHGILRYVWIINQDQVVQLRPVVVDDLSDDLFIVKRGVAVGDKIVLERIGQVRVGQKVKCGD